MPDEPNTKRAVAFYDGQNLYHHAKAAFGHYHPNYHPTKLFNAVCADSGWINPGIRFYTGTPDFKRDEMWHGYWTSRLLAMRRAGILVTHGPLRYYAHEITGSDGVIGTVEPLK